MLQQYRHGTEQMFSHKSSGVKTGIWNENYVNTTATDGPAIFVAGSSSATLLSVGCTGSEGRNLTSLPSQFCDTRDIVNTLSCNLNEFIMTRDTLLVPVTW